MHAVLPENAHTLLFRRKILGFTDTNWLMLQLALSLAISIYFVYWIATKLLIHIFICTTCSHISHSIWRNINNTKAWAKAKCSNLTEIFALLLWILVLLTRSPPLSVCWFVFPFHFPFRTICPYFIACRMPSKCKTTNYYNTRADCILFSCLKRWNLWNVVRLQFFSKCKSVSSSFCLFVRCVRLFINEIQYYTGYELWALCITLLHWPLFLAVYYSFYVLIFNFHCTLFPLWCRSI